MAFLSLVVGLSSALAQDPAIASGEFRNTADTTPKGEFVIHPLLRSSYGITEKLDLKLSPLGFLLGGPQVFVEYQIVGGDGVRISVEPAANLTWNFRSYAVGGMVRSTVPVGENRFNLSAGGSYVRLPHPDHPLATRNPGHAVRSASPGRGQDEQGTTPVHG